MVKAEIGKYNQQMLLIKKSGTFAMSASSAIYNVLNAQAIKASWSILVHL